jgi:hypothetical protein
MALEFAAIGINLKGSCADIAINCHLGENPRRDAAPLRLPEREENRPAYLFAAVCTVSPTSWPKESSSEWPSGSAIRAV